MKRLFLSFLVLYTSFCFAEPFVALSASDLSSDSIMEMGAVTPVATTLPANTFTSVPLTNSTGSASFYTYPNSSVVTQSGGYLTSGPLLKVNGGGKVYIYPPSDVQGVGVVMEHTYPVGAEYVMEFYDSALNVIKTIRVDSNGNQGDPKFLGGVDPDSRITIIGLSALPDTGFAISDVIFQSAPHPIPSLNDLVAFSTLPAPLEVAQKVTYLHEGYGNIKATPLTVNATSDNSNAHDIKAYFPSLKPGDLLRFERVGLGLNRSRKQNGLLGVFSAQNTILQGGEFDRVPDAVSVGRTYFTKSIKAKSISTPTNIPEDFHIGQSTHIEYLNGANYLFLSRERPEEVSNPVKLKISHIKRSKFNEWLEQLGLYGQNANIDNDMDGDGLTLLEEYVFRKNPTHSDNESSAFSYLPNFNTKALDGTPLLSFGAKKDAALNYTIEFSSDLENWDTVENPEPFFIEKVDTPNAIFLIPDPVSRAERFARLHIDFF